MKKTSMDDPATQYSIPSNSLLMKAVVGRIGWLLYNIGSRHRRQFGSRLVLVVFGVRSEMNSEKHCPSSLFLTIRTPNP
jgi:hypothetical protein